MIESMILYWETKEDPITNIVCAFIIFYSFFVQWHFNYCMSAPSEWINRTIIISDHIFITVAVNHPTHVYYAVFKPRILILCKDNWIVGEFQTAVSTNCGDYGLYVHPAMNATCSKDWICNGLGHRAYDLGCDSPSHVSSFISNKFFVLTCLPPFFWGV